MRLAPPCLLILALAAGAAPNAFAQRLDPDFPAGTSSYVEDVADAYLDIETADVDVADVLVPRTLGGGVTMVLTGREQGTSMFGYHRIGLRRMSGTGATFSATVPTQVITANEAGVVDGADPDGGVCLLIDSADSVVFSNSTSMACLDDSGLDASNVNIGLAGDGNQYGGGIRKQDGTMVIVGAVATQAAPSTYKLFFERRFPVSGALFAPRTEHFLHFGSVLPVDTRLRVHALEGDGNGRWLVAGRMLRANGANETEAFVARFNANFSLDTSFGTQGIVDLGFGVGNGGVTHYDAEALDLAVLDSGAIVVVGIGCATSACGLPIGNETFSRQPLTAILSPDGVPRGPLGVTFSGTASDPLVIHVEPTRHPFTPRNSGPGFVLFEQYSDGVNLIRTFSERDAVTPVHSRTSALRYSDTTIVPEPRLADATTTRTSNRTRHYAAWTVKATTANPTDTDMVMGELQPLVVFGDGFE